MELLVRMVVVKVWHRLRLTEKRCCQDVMSLEPDHALCLALARLPCQHLCLALVLVG